MEDQVQLKREGAEDSPGNAENVEGEEKTGKVSKERIERLKRTFRPNRLQDIVDTQEKGNQRKKITK